MGKKSKIIDTLGIKKTLHEKMKEVQKRGKGVRVNENKKSNRIRWADLESAFESRVRTAVIINLKHKNLLQFLKDSKSLIKRCVKKALKQNNGLKVNFIFTDIFSTISNGKIIEEKKFFNTKNVIIFPSTDIDLIFDNVIDYILQKVEDFNGKETGWSLKEIINLIVNINRFAPLQGGSKTFIEMPKFIKKEKAVVNIKNDDNFCFLWSIVAALYPVKNNSTIISFYPDFRKILKYEGIDFPIALTDVPKFEKMNNLRIHIYDVDNIGSNKKEIVPLHINDQFSEKSTIQLLMIKNTNTYFNNIKEGKFPSKCI